MRITLPSGTPAELAVPSSTPTRGVALAPDIAGLRDLFDDLCQRLADEYGWAVCAAEPFPGRESMSLEERFQAMPGLDDDRQVGDLVAAGDVLRERTGVDRVAVLGFCMGGMYTFKAAASGRFDRAVPFYGMIRIPPDWRGPHNAEPLELLKGPNTCPVLAIIGERDPYTPPDAVAELEQLPHVRTARYPDAEHGFVHAPERPSHRPDDAADAWRKVADFLA